jgi:hypothetical protein
MRPMAQNDRLNRSNAVPPTKNFLAVFDADYAAKVFIFG